MQNLMNEDMFMSIYKTNHLNPTFDVLYQESVRGNHILFNPKDVEAWGHLGRQTPSEQTLEQVCEAFASLFSLVSYREMCELVDRLEEQTRYWLFRVYLNFIEALKVEVRGSFN